jgi:hypothetical protein
LDYQGFKFQGFWWIARVSLEGFVVGFRPDCQGFISLDRVPSRLPQYYYRVSSKLLDVSSQLKTFRPFQ